MEISFEKGKFVYCPGGFNYQEVLDDFKRAKKVRIITYNISGTGNTDPLLEQIKKLGEDVDVQIITNIPSRFETYYSSAWMYGICDFYYKSSYHLFDDKRKSISFGVQMFKRKRYYSIFYKKFSSKYSCQYEFV